MGDLGATLIKELNCETAFAIGGIGISESVVVTWIMMAVVLVVSLIVTHGLKVEHPGRGQLLLENAVTWLQGIGEGILGEEGKGYAPYLTSVLMYLGVANLLGILGFKPPTKDLNVTAAQALMAAESRCTDLYVLARPDPAQTGPGQELRSVPVMR